MTSIELDIDQRALRFSADATLSRLLQHNVSAVHKATRGLEKALEAATKRTAGGRLDRAWQSEANPPRGRGAYSPAGRVFLKGRARTKGAIAYWSRQGVNRRGAGEYLAIPTKNAGVISNRRPLTPGEWERRNGIRLRYVYRGGGRPALLVAPLVRTMSKAGRSALKGATKGRIKKYGAASADRIIFVLIAQQRHANAFSIPPMIEAAAKALSTEVARGPA